MSGMLFCVAAMAFGVDLGYRVDTDGVSEYIIQIDPDTLQYLNPNEPLTSLVPADARDIHPGRILVVMGKGKLPRELPARAPESATGPRFGSSDGARESTGPSLGQANADPNSRYSTAMAPRSAQNPGTDPRTLTADPNSRPINEQTGFNAPQSGPQRTESPIASNNGANDLDKTKLIWAWLFVAVLFATNVYVGWLYWDARVRYLQLVSQTLSGEDALAG